MRMHLPKRLRSTGSARRCTCTYRPRRYSAPPVPGVLPQPYSLSMACSSAWAASSDMRPMMPSSELLHSAMSPLLRPPLPLPVLRRSEPAMPDESAAVSCWCRRRDHAALALWQPAESCSPSDCSPAVSAASGGCGAVRCSDKRRPWGFETRCLDVDAAGSAPVA